MAQVEEPLNFILTQLAIIVKVQNFGMRVSILQEPLKNKYTAYSSQGSHTGTPVKNILQPIIRWQHNRIMYLAFCSVKYINVDFYNHKRYF